MAEKIRQFKCFAIGCGQQTPFDVVGALRKRNFMLTCQHCQTRWNGHYFYQTCCKVSFKFKSVEEDPKKSLIKVQSFSLK
jgi:hypothetical protein